MAAGRADLTGEDHAGVEADALLEELRVDLDETADLRVQQVEDLVVGLGQRAAQLQRRAGGAQRVVLVGGRRAEQRHQLIAKGVHIHLVDDSAIAVDYLLGAAVVGVEHAHRRIAIVAQQIERDAERIEVGEQHRDRPKLAGIGRGAGKLGWLQEAARQAARQIGPQGIQPLGQAD